MTWIEKGSGLKKCFVLKRAKKLREGDVKIMSYQIKKKSPELKTLEWEILNPEQWNKQKKKSGSSINPDIHNSKVPSSSHFSNALFNPVTFFQIRCLINPTLAKSLNIPNLYIGCNAVKCNFTVYTFPCTVRSRLCRPTMFYAQKVAGWIDLIQVLLQLGALKNQDHFSIKKNSYSISSSNIPYKGNFNEGIMP